MEKEKNWEIILTKPAERIYNTAPKGMKGRLDKCFESLEKNPLRGSNIRPLTGKLKGLCRYRVGDWRIIYRILLDQMIVEIIAILPRGNAYK